MEVLPEKAVRDEGEPCAEERNLETVCFLRSPGHLEVELLGSHLSWAVCSRQEGE